MSPDHTHGLYIHHQGGKPHFTGSYEEVRALISELTAAERARGWIIVPLFGDGIIQPPRPKPSWPWIFAGASLAGSALFALVKIISSGW